MNGILHTPMFAPLREKIEKRLIARFKAYYSVYDKRLKAKNVRCIVVRYVGNNSVYIETTYKRGMHCGQHYITENEFLSLLREKNTEAIFYNCLLHLDRECIIRNAKSNNETPFGYVIDYLKDVYSLPKMIGCDIAEKILKQFKIDNECFS